MKTGRTPAILAAIALLSGCASTPDDSSQGMDFVWGCWVQKSAPDGEIEAFLRLLPNGKEGTDAQYAGEIRNVTPSDYDAREGLSFARDGSAASFWVFGPLVNDDPDVDRLPFSAEAFFDRDPHPAPEVQPFEHRAIFKHVNSPDNALVVEATAERLRVSQSIVGEPPYEPMFDGERDGCD